MKITIAPNYKQHLAYEALKDPSIDTIFLGGGAGGGKSWFICESRLINCLRYEGYKSFIAREELKRLMQSTFVTWSKVCRFHKVPQDSWHLNGQYNYIEFKNTGARIDLLDAKALPGDPLFERFGSLEYTDGAFEEAGEISFLSYDVLGSRVGRHMNEEFGLHPSKVVTGNPKKNWTYSEFYKPWKNKILPKNQIFIQSLYMDNKYTAASYGKVLDNIKDKQTKERLKFGNWEYDDDPTALINYDAMCDLFTNSVRRSQQKYLICDIARFGKDRAVFYLFEGLKLVKIYIFEKLGINELNTQIKTIAKNEFVPYSHILADEDGVGGGVVDGVVGIRGFVANSSPLENKLSGEDENFKNLKAQCSYKLAEYINNHQIAIEVSIASKPAKTDAGFEFTDEVFKEWLKEELGYIKSKDADKDGKRKIMPKDEIKEKLGRSPDFSDTLMMRMYFELLPNEDDILLMNTKLAQSSGMGYTGFDTPQHQGGIIR